jgi:predicted metal-dependent phosphotriesterase family hydrolase
MLRVTRRSLKAKGVSDDVIKTIMEDNPRRVLTFVAPQKQVKQKAEPRK